MLNYTDSYTTGSFRQAIQYHSSRLSDKLNRLNSELHADLLCIMVKHDRMLESLVAVANEPTDSAISFDYSGTFAATLLEGKDEYIEANCERIAINTDPASTLPFSSCMAVPICNDSDEPFGVVVAFFKSARHFDNTQTLFLTFSDYLNAFLQKSFLKHRTNAHLSLLNEVQAISHTGAWEYDLVTKKVFWSEEIYRIYGIPTGQEVNADKAFTFYAKSVQPIIQKALERLTQQGKPYDLQLPFIDATGKNKWVRTTGSAEFDEQGSVIRVFGVFEDITAYKTLSLVNQERAERIENILNNINDAVVTVSDEGVIKHVNQVALEMFGFEQHQLIGQSVSVLMPAPYASKHSEYMQQYLKTGHGRIIGVGRQLPALRKNGEIFQMELSLSESYEDGKKQFIGVIRDISERLEAEDAIYNLAFTDNVTGLRNSQWFEREAKELMFKAMQDHHCIHALLLNMDKMAAFNQRYGFNQGDSALRSIADNLKSIVGNEYTIYKYSADAFIVLSRKTVSKTALYKFNTKIIESALLHPENYQLHVQGEQTLLSASLGSAIFDPGEHSFESMLSVLEHALRQAKQNAPFGLCHIAQDGIEQYDRFITIQSKLSTLPESNELSMVLQPQVDSEGQLNSFEALIRWVSPELGMISPADFIPLAEESGAIIAIGEWVIEQACKDINTLIALGLNASVAINISARQIVSPQFADRLIDVINQYRIPAGYLMLELTETALVTDMALVKRTMDRLAHEGLRFSIDDFGTGYSSLAYLKELPISEIKIDKYFVDDITDKHPNQHYPIIDAIIHMANALNVTCVAEGVENKVQLEYLKQRGCHRYQGYYFSKPLNRSDWTALVKKHVSISATEQGS